MKIEEFSSEEIMARLKRPGDWVFIHSPARDLPKLEKIRASFSVYFKRHLKGKAEYSSKLVYRSFSCGLFIVLVWHQDYKVTWPSQVIHKEDLPDGSAS